MFSNAVKETAMTMALTFEKKKKQKTKHGV